MRLHNRRKRPPISLPVLSELGQVVRKLCQVNAGGNVVMRFERCAYLQFDKQLVCIGLNVLGGSPITGLFGHSVQTLPQSLAIGATAQLSTEYLLVESRYYYGLSDAMLYTSRLQYKKLHCKKPTIQYALLSKLIIPSSGLAPLLRHFTTTTAVAGSTIAENAFSNESELLSFTKPAISHLLKQLRANCASRSAKTVQHDFDSELIQRLVGAGPGLTPSGDDFLCGVFVALRQSDFSATADALWARVRPIAKRSTTQVSFAIMEQSALGESGERLEAIVQAYYHYPKTDANEFQRLIEQIGETSGWDWLTGFVMCGDILCNSPINSH